MELAKLATYAASGKSQPTSSIQPESTVNPFFSWKTLATSSLLACTVIRHPFLGELLDVASLEERVDIKYSLKIEVVGIISR